MAQAPIENIMKRIFSEKLWQEYAEKIEEDFNLKTYPQFDPYFDFPKNKHKLYEMVSDPSLKRIYSHDFTPLVKVLQKTPRYRYQVGEDNYGLETKIRPISFASHFDTYIYGFYAFALNKFYQDYIKENDFQDVVLAYRSDLDGKCNIQFAKEAFGQVKQVYKKYGECSVIALDIKGYFDHIDHGILKKLWCKIINEDDLPLDQYKVFRSLTKYSYVNYSSFLKHFKINLKKLERQQKKKHKGKERIPKGYQSLLDLIPDELNGISFNSKMDLLRKRNLITINRNKNRSLSKNGIPQGSAMSALLSNIYLSDFDKEVFEKGQKEGFIYRRYCDDLLIICRSEQVNILKDYLMDLISREYKLTIQDKKTEVIDFKSSLKGQIRSYRREYDEIKKIFNPLPNQNKYFKNLQYLGFEFNGVNTYIRPGSLSRYFRKMKARVVKSVSMAYSKNSKSDVIFKQQIYSRYSHIGKRNFLTYALNASKSYYLNSKGEKKEGMDSPSIKRQIAAHMRILKNEIEKTSSQKARQKRIKKVKK